ncbi:penicillin acylase family protein [Porticoccaceae bacterium]|jgi:acyl-homoserine-lactone acylase|nr:penicillin acylase family protein [Porticoccaceae bacterium]
MKKTYLLLCITILTLSACQPEPKDSSLYQVDITRTQFGVPHIKAADYGSLGYGEAYASGQDQVCNMAVALITAKGQAAQYLGVGHENAYLYSDMVIDALNMPLKGRKALAVQPEKIKKWIEGYTAGYNRYLSDSAGEYDSWCNHASWVKPATAEDFMTQYVASVHTITRMAGAVVAAQPPATTTSIEVSQSQQLAALKAIKLEGMGSNGWAFGSKATENGKGTLLANPHYPWYGTSRFWEKHLMIPGELDVYGTNLVGNPGVAIGFNNAIGWTHTVSDSKRVVLYQLTLNPEDPTQYRYQGEWRSLEARDVSVNVLTNEGIDTRTAPVWFSHHGPIIQMPGLEWSAQKAYATRDANSENTQVMSQWLAMGQAQSMDEFIQAHETYNSMPWVNTISTSAEGRAVYLDNSNVGALSSEAIEAWNKRIEQVPQLKQLYLTKGLVILDGSTLRDEWISHPDASIPGTTTFEQRPLIESDYYVFNSNDSYWLSDPAHPVTGYSPLYGATETPRSVRTRMNVHLLDGLDGFDFRGEDGLFSTTEIQAALFDNSGLAAHLLKPELLERCNKNPKVIIDVEIIDLTSACIILENWDNRYDLDSRGAVLFREWITRYDINATRFSGSLFTGQFDKEKPALTPLGLVKGKQPLQALAQAVVLLNSEGIALDSPLGDVQKAHRAGTAIAVHGGNSHEGIANLQVTRPYIDSPIFSGNNDRLGDSKTLSSSGYNIAHGSSFIMTLNFTDEGPQAQAILSYSQSGAPKSENFSDQTARYRDKQWRDIYFERSDIAKHSLSSLSLSE